MSALRGGRLPPRLDVDSATRPCRYLDRGCGQGERKSNHRGGESVQPEGRTLGGLTRLGATDGFVQVGVPGKLAGEAVDPSEDDLPAPQVADPLHPQAQGLELGQQCRRAQMDEMARQIKGKPAIAEDAGLEAGRIGHGDDKRSEEHTSELQSQSNLVCRLLLEKKT